MNEVLLKRPSSGVFDEISKSWVNCVFHVIWWLLFVSNEFVDVNITIVRVLHSRMVIEVRETRAKFPWPPCL